MKLNRTAWGGLTVLLAAIAANDILLLANVPAYVGFWGGKFGLESSGLARSGLLWLSLHGLFVAAAAFWLLVVQLSDGLSEAGPEGKCCYGVALLLLVAYLAAWAVLPQSAVNAMYREDGIFESVTPVADVGAAIFLLLSVRRSEPLARTMFKAFLAMACFVVGMEEISWGQRIFHWGGFSGNIQGETTVHNFVQQASLFPVYMGMDIAIGLILLFRERAAEFLRRVPPLSELVPLLPPQWFRLYGVFLLTLPLAFFYSPIADEFNEEVISVFWLMYSLHRYRLDRP